MVGRVEKKIEATIVYWGYVGYIRLYRVVVDLSMVRIMVCLEHGAGQRSCETSVSRQMCRKSLLEDVYGDLSETGRNPPSKYH